MVRQVSGDAASSGPAPARAKPLAAHVDDSYKARGKLKEPSACTDCGAIFQGGRWCWEARPPQVHEVVCPACQRIRDAQPAGYLTLKGDFLAQHRDEILNILHNVEAREKAEHPLQRIMALSDTAEGMLVTTTDAHLARDLGVALQNACQGELESNYAEDENMVRVLWHR